jgi:AcrR family transcriptional regulator
MYNLFKNKQEDGIFIMPPKTKYPKEMVIEAAITLLETKGEKGFSAREIAALLNSSVNPIYKNFTSVNELKYCALKRILELFLSYERKEYTTDPWTNVGVGYVLFSKEHPNLFQVLFNSMKTEKEIDRLAWNSILEDALKMEKFKSYDSAMLEKIFMKHWIYTHGAACLIQSGLIEVATVDDIVELLQIDAK